MNKSKVHLQFRHGIKGVILMLICSCLQHRYTIVDALVKIKIYFRFIWLVVCVGCLHCACCSLKYGTQISSIIQHAQAISVTYTNKDHHLIQIFEQELYSDELYQDESRGNKVRICNTFLSFELLWIRRPFTYSFTPTIDKVNVSCERILSPRWWVRMLILKRNLLRTGR